jgi:hypothetical protein
MDPIELARKTAQTQSDLAELKATVRQLQVRVDRQALVLQVLKEMLLAGRAAAEDDFLARLEQLAAAQKVEDKVCGKCGKPMSARHNRCMYCGEARPPELV